MTSRSEIEAACEAVYAAMPPTAQYCWPLLSQRLGLEVWVKHESQTPIGAFKLRGGLVYMAELRERHPSVTHVVAATRGNHGQSVALAARRVGLRATVVVPEGNGREKNAAIRANGAELVVEGHDFQAALECAERLVAAENSCLVPPFDPALARGVATYSYELLGAVPGLDAIYVPIGMGSGVCGAILAREALSLRTEIIGVVSSGAPAYARSFAAGSVVPTTHAITMADGLACRVPNAEVVALLCRHAARVVEVDDDEIEAAMRVLFTDTHTVAEGAGAAALAGLMQERAAMAGKRVAVVLSGGNVDRETYAAVLAASSDPASAGTRAG